MWKCTACGHENEASAKQCAACMLARSSRLCLVSEATGRRVVFSISTDVGRYLLRDLVGEEQRYLSDPQFRVVLEGTDRRWAILHSSKAKNPTWINGEPLAETPVPADAGAVISVGPTKAAMKIEIEYCD